MRIRTSWSLLPLLLAASLVTGCVSRKPVAPSTAASSGDGKTSNVDDVDEYAVELVSDPFEKFNRGTFTLNHGLYTYVFRPISKGYQAIIPKPVRTGIHNAFENVKFPVRFVNDTLQGDFKRAGYETGRFVVNTVVGVGGIGRPSDHIPALADIPAGDTGQTFAKWGIANGPYIVLPILGPSTVRDTFGLAGDYALNPVNWVTIWYGGYAWTLAIPSTNTLRALPVQMDAYDAATKDSLDRYLAARSSYIQYRNEVNAKAKAK